MHQKKYSQYKNSNRSRYLSFDAIQKEKVHYGIMLNA